MYARWGNGNGKRGMSHGLPRLTDNKYFMGGSLVVEPTHNTRNIVKLNRHSRGISETTHMQLRMFNLFLFIAINGPLAYVRLR